MKDTPKDGFPRGRTDPSVPDAGDLFARTVKTVREAILHAANDAGDEGGRLLDAVVGVAHASLHAALKTGGNLVLGAKAILVGVLKGTGERETAAAKTISSTSCAVIRSAAKLGGDLSACMIGLVLGAIASARDIGVDRAQAASAAAQGALEGAEEAGSAAADAIRRSLRENIGGTHVELPESIKN